MDQERSNRLERHFPAGATLFEQGDTSRETYILLNGEAEVLGNDERVAVVAEAGSYLEEMSPLLSEPRTSTVRTTKESSFIIVGPGQVRAFFSYSAPTRSQAGHDPGQTPEGDDPGPVPSPPGT